MFDFNLVTAAAVASIASFLLEVWREVKQIVKTHRKAKGESRRSDAN